MKILDPQQAIVFDGLDMFGENEFEGNLFTLETIAEGMDWGAPDPDVSWLENVLRDGAIASTQGHKNREVYLKVKVSAEDGIALAAGETALARAAGKRTTLTWTPPDGWAPTSVFDVETSKLEPETNDLDELRVERVYGLRFWCLPFTRSVNETTVVDDSVSTTESTSVLDSCSATTGWAASNTGPTVVSGKVRTSITTSTTGNKSLWLEKSFTLSDVTRPYLRVKWATTLPWTSGFVAVPPSLTLTLDGVEVAASAVYGDTVWFKVDTPGTVVVRLASSGHKSNIGSSTYNLDIDEVALTNVSGQVYPNIKAFSVPIGGAMRAPATITVAHASTGLGDVLLYTWPRKGGYQPILHPYRTGPGIPTADAACVSGGREPLDAGPTYTVPVAYVPRGSYLLVARMQTTGAAGRRTVTWSAETSATGDAVDGTCYVEFATTNAWQIVIIDRIPLPPTRVTDDSTRNLLLTLDSPDTDVQLDVALICHDDGALSIVGAGGNKSVSAIPPSTTDPTEWLATEDVMAADVTAWGRHMAQPPELAGTVITTGVASPVVSATYFKRWLTHAME